jgi:transposase
MAGKTKSMTQIKQLLLLRKQGKGFKTIAKTLSISKNTVKEYVRKTETLLNESKGLTIDKLIKMEEPELAAIFHAGNPAYKDESRYEHLKSKLDYYVKELNRTGVTKQLLWTEYRQGAPSGYSLSQFSHHLLQHQIASNPTLVLTHKPAEKLYIDFAGKKLSYVDIETGEQIYCSVFVACLPYSDYGFAMAVKDQSAKEFIYALGKCLEYLGGVPLALVPDNLKSAVIKSSRYEPDINSLLEDFANHYNTTIIPTRTYKPRDKALVENHVKLVYNRVYARIRNLQFFNLHDLNKAITECIRLHNQTRMQQKPWCREEHFLAEEKKLLSPLPAQGFEIKYYKELKVAKNNCIYLSDDKHYYSVPYIYIGSKVKVVYTRNLVNIYANGKQVASHVRNYKPGTYSLIHNHLCSHHRQYLELSPDKYIQRAAAKSAVLQQLVTLLFKYNKVPEKVYRTCDGLFALQKRYSKELFEKACQIAIEHQNYSYRFVKNILENKMTEAIEIDFDKPLPKHTNIRGQSYFRKLTQNMKSFLFTF